MKLTQIDLWHVAIPAPEPFYPSWIPGFPQTENRFTLARLSTASGVVGWSAGAAMGRERAGLGDLLGPYLLGERADDIASIRQRVREMSYLGWRVGWLEAACWDIVGKARAKPVYELLGGQGGVAKLYASTGEVKRGPERVVEVEARRAEGFEAVKLRVHAMTLEEDLAQIEDTRRGVGDDMILGVDANQGWRVAVVDDAPRWDYERALAFCRGCEAQGLTWVEEPLAMDAYADLARLREATKIMIAGGELNSQGLPEFGVMIDKGCYDWYQPDACFVGGIAEAWKIAQLARAAGYKYSPHTWTNGIGFAINLQLYGALIPAAERESTFLEYPYNPPSWVHSVRDGLLREPWQHRCGRLELPTRPGLGFEIDRRILRRHAKHFFRATGIRMAAHAVLDKGLKIAQEIGRRRDARLAARDRELERAVTDGGDPALDALK